jgi:NAD(P)-dependent dehydrogenase (short-subunit alcohol dehydrogenase family)
MAPVTRPAGHAIVVGNSDGIGLGFTRRLLDAGWTVTGLSRSPSAVRHDRYAHEVVDVTAPEYRSVLARAVEAREGVELCVYAAGVGELLDLADLPAQTAVLDVNLMGAARTVEVVVPPMLRAGRGHLIGLSSLADVNISAEAPSYAASKAGMSAYLMSLALALRPHGVHVTTVRFGFVDTKMAKAPVKPMLISTDEAVDVLLRCVRTRPAVVSYPRRMAVAARALRAVLEARLRTGR